MFPREQASGCGGKHAGLPQMSYFAARLFRFFTMVPGISLVSRSGTAKACSFTRVSLTARMPVRSDLLSFRLAHG